MDSRKPLRETDQPSSSEEKRSRPSDLVQKALQRSSSGSDLVMPSQWETQKRTLNACLTDLQKEVQALILQRKDLEKRYHNSMHCIEEYHRYKSKEEEYGGKVEILLEEEQNLLTLPNKNLICDVYALGEQHRHAENMEEQRELYKKWDLLREELEMCGMPLEYPQCEYIRRQDLEGKESRYRIETLIDLYQVSSHSMHLFYVKEGTKRRYKVMIEKCKERALEGERLDSLAANQASDPEAIQKQREEIQELREKYESSIKDIIEYKYTKVDKDKDEYSSLKDLSEINRKMYKDKLCEIKDKLYKKYQKRDEGKSNICGVYGENSHQFLQSHLNTTLAKSQSEQYGQESRKYEKLSIDAGIAMKHYFESIAKQEKIKKQYEKIQVVIQQYRDVKDCTDTKKDEYEKACQEISTLALDLDQLRLKERKSLEVGKMVKKSAEIVRKRELNKIKRNLYQHAIENCEKDLKIKKEELNDINRKNQEIYNSVKNYDLYLNIAQSSLNSYTQQLEAIKEKEYQFIIDINKNYCKKELEDINRLIIELNDNEKELEKSRNHLTSIREEIDMDFVIRNTVASAFDIKTISCSECEYNRHIPTNANSSDIKEKILKLEKGMHKKFEVKDKKVMERIFGNDKDKIRKYEKNIELHQRLVQMRECSEQAIKLAKSYPRNQGSLESLLANFERIAKNAFDDAYKQVPLVQATINLYTDAICAETEVGNKRNAIPKDRVTEAEEALHKFKREEHIFSQMRVSDGEGIKALLKPSHQEKILAYIATVDELLRLHVNFSKYKELFCKILEQEQNEKYQMVAGKLDEMIKNENKKNSDFGNKKNLLLNDLEELNNRHEKTINAINRNEIYIDKYTKEIGKLAMEANTRKKEDLSMIKGLIEEISASDLKSISFDHIQSLFPFLRRVDHPRAQSQGSETALPENSQTLPMAQVDHVVQRLGRLHLDTPALDQGRTT